MSQAILRSYQVFGANDQVLSAAFDALKTAVKDAKSQSKVQRVALHRKGYRHDIEVGDIYVVPVSVCNKPEDFPHILLDVNLRKHATSEGMVEFQMGALVDSDELTRETLQAFKEVAFKNEKGDYAPLIVFAPSWAHPSGYQSFVYNEDTALANLRDVAYASPFNPSLSSVFDQLRAVDPDSAPLTKIMPSTQHIYRVEKSEEPDYPEFAKGLDLAAEEGSSAKSASLGRRVIRLTGADIPKLEHEDLSDAELGMFQAIEKEVQQNVKRTAAECTPASTFAPQAGSTDTPAQAAEITAPATTPIFTMASADGNTDGKTHGDTDFDEHRQRGENLELGEAGNVSDRTPDVVDGPSPVTAATEDDKNNVPLNGLAPEMQEGDTEPGKGADEATAMQTKEAGLFDAGAAFSQGTVQAVNAFVQHWGGRVLSEEGLKSELKKVTDKLKPAVLFMKEQGLIKPYGQGQYQILNRDLAAEEKDKTKLSYVITDPKTKAVWAAAIVDGISFGGEWVKEASQAARYASKTAATDDVRRNMLTAALVVAKTCEDGHECDGKCTCPAPKVAGNWWNPGTVLEQFMPELQHDVVDSPFISQQEDPNLINPFGAPGKGTSQDPNATGLNQGLDSNAGGVPLRQEMSFYGPEFSRNFYAPHADIPAAALTFKRPKAAGTGKEAFLPALIPIAEAGAAALEGGAAAAGAAEAGAAGAEAGGLSVGDALSMVPPPQQDENKQARRKKADGALAFFQGLDMAAPEEEHPQAHTDETAATPETGNYNEPSKEDAVPQDETYLAVDKFLKGVLGGYAAQLIAVFQVTNKPLALSAPFEDHLDLAETIRVTGGPQATAQAQEAAVAQFQTAMNKLTDDQKKMLVDGAIAQAAVWCNNAKGSGGFNYEVFVRAQSLDGTTLVVKVVTGTK